MKQEEPQRAREADIGLLLEGTDARTYETITQSLGMQLIRLAAGQETSFAYQPDLTVTVVLDIVENDGDALLEVFESDSSLCTATGEQISGAPETMNVDVTFHGVGTCILSFDAFGPGVYSFNIVLPAPIALTAR